MKQFLLISTMAVMAMSSKVHAAKSFVYCSEGSPSTFNPQQATDGPTFNASSRTIYNRLVEFKTGSTQLEPSLAESWTVSKDGLTYTFKLRKDVSFHSNEFFKPSRKMNADDVVYSFAVQKDKNHPLGSKTAVYEYFSSMEMDKLIKEIKKLDDHTVQFVLNRPEAPFLANMAMDFASILSKEYAEKLVAAKKSIETMNTEPIGTGPFVFKSYQKDNIIRFVKNENYFKNKAKIDQLIFAITPDPSVRFQKLKAKECHFVSEPAPQDIDLISKNNQLKLLSQEGLNVGYLAMNVEKKPLNDVKVRKAIAMALNRDSYIQAIYLGRAEKAKNPIPPTMWSYDTKTKNLDHDLTQAKKLLTEAGYANGFEIELWSMPVSRPYNPSGKKMAEMMQSDLQKIGVKVKIVTFDWPTYLEKARKGEHQLLQIGWTGDNGDPDNFLHVLLGCAAVKSGANYARWCDKNFDQLIEKAKITTQQKNREALYRKAQGIFQQEMPWVPLAYAKVYRAMLSNVEGYKIHPFGSDIFTEVDIK